MSVPTLRFQVAAAFEPLLAPSRYKGAYGGRGGAKSHFFAEQLIARCVKQRTRAACIREVQSSLKESVKQLVEDKIQRYGLGREFEVLQTEIRTPHDGLIIFKGMQSYNAESIKSLEDYDIAWVEEAQTLSSVSLRMLRPTIRKDGSELWFSWNPRHKADAVDRFLRGPQRPPGAIVVPVGWQDNPWLPDVLRQEKDHDYATNPDVAEHVWGGAYEVITEGAYYAKLLLDAEKEGRITDVPYDPNEPVYTAWDLGLDDSTAIWFAQIIGLQVRIIDFYEVRNVALLDVARTIMKRPYVYAEHYMPHDVETREISTAKTRKQQLEDIGFRPIRPGSKLPVADGINAARTLLQKCVFDRVKCDDGISALQKYRTEYVEKDDVFKDKPKHDFASHPADAFRELAVQLYDTKAQLAAKRASVSLSEYHPFDVGSDTFARNVEIAEERRREQTSGVDDYRPW